MIDLMMIYGSYDDYMYILFYGYDKYWWDIFTTILSDTPSSVMVFYVVLHVIYGRIYRETA